MLLLAISTVILGDQALQSRIGFKFVTLCYRDFEEQQNNYDKNYHQYNYDNFYHNCSDIFYHQNNYDKIIEKAQGSDLTAAYLCSFNT